jgi:hypothetical protein
MKPANALLENSVKRLAHAKELHAKADAARRRSSEHKQDARSARVTMERLRDDTVQWLRHESPLETAERHVAESERHVELQRKLLGRLVRDRHETMIGHAQEVLEVLEQRRKLAHAHLALERAFRDS